LVVDKEKSNTDEATQKAGSETLTLESLEAKAQKEF
jgi:hypothetical protein